MSCVRRFVQFRNRRLGGALSADEVEDTVQESLFAVWRKLERFEGRASLETWVYRFVHLEVATRLRRKHRRPLLLEEVEAPDPEVPAPVVRSLEYERLYRSLEVLGPPGADVIRLKHLEALTFEEIGERLGISINTAKTQYYRGLRTLRDLYAPAAPILEGGES